VTEPEFRATNKSEQADATNRLLAANRTRNGRENLHPEEDVALPVAGRRSLTFDSLVLNSRVREIPPSKARVICRGERHRLHFAGVETRGGCIARPQRQEFVNCSGVLFRETPLQIESIPTCRRVVQPRAVVLSTCAVSVRSTIKLRASST
jgi:hypothetical protein